MEFGLFKFTPEEERIQSFCAFIALSTKHIRVVTLTVFVTHKYYIVHTHIFFLVTNDIANHIFVFLHVEQVLLGTQHGKKIYLGLKDLGSAKSEGEVNLNFDWVCSFSLT